MKMSLSWLSYYVDIDVPVQELCDKMTMAGFEIEEIEDLSKTMEKVVAGKILKIEKHPNSDHLQICQIDVGESEPVQIVTGAQNVFEGACVPAALHNSLLPNGMKIKKGKLRGVESNGMLCSGEELNLKESDYPGAEVKGILILQEDYRPGTDMREILKLNDYIIDFKITANRPDCQSVLGVAREAAVVLKKECKIPQPVYKTAGGDMHSDIKITVKNSELCPRYLGRMVKNLRVKESPDWLKRCVKSAGMRPINNIVDITNFVMLETGQPMHAFDYNDILGKEIIVRNAYEGEKMTTLDGKEHTLSSDMLVIADGEKPSCLAGVMGGLNSEIKPETRDLFLEAAKFKRDNVRKTARALGMRTESSARFEKGVDIKNVEYAMNRALQLISDLDAGDIVDGVIDINNGLPADRELTVSAQSVNGLLGVEVPESTMCDILNSLHIKTTLENGVLHCFVPSFRDDIEGRADLAEEIMRIYGYGHIVGTTMRGNIIRGRLLPERIVNDKLKTILCANGLYEISTYSFISSRAVEALRLDPDDARLKAVTIINPLGEEFSAMRTQLITSMMTVLSTNYNRDISAARFFELSKLFVSDTLPPVRQPEEVPALSIGLYGKEDDFFTLKGIVESIYAGFGMKVSYERSAENYLHPGRQAAVVFEGEPIGVLGEVHPEVAENYGFDDRVYVAELKLRPLYSYKKTPVIYKPLPKFPAVTRDLALLCADEIPIGELEKTITRAAGSLCEQIALFDVYKGKQIPDGQKSVAFSLVLRNKEKTLTDEEVEAAMQKVFSALSKLDVSLRV